MRFARANTVLQAAGPIAFGAGAGYENALRRSDDPNLDKAFREAQILSLGYCGTPTALAWKSPIGTILSMGMEYHIVHHLVPRIPLFQTGPAYHEMRRMLDERGCRNDRPDRDAS